MIESVAETISTLLLVALLAGAYAVDRYRTEPTPAEEAREAYRNDEITLEELERRLDVELDPEAERIRGVLERVNGVGPETSRTIAERFDSLEEVRRASQDELEAIHDVGPSTASAIKERLS
jgi:ERCC4-type nuclease